MLMEAAVHRIERHVLERVMHPSHVPLQIEAQATVLHAVGNPRPGRGFLGDCERRGKFVVNGGVELLQECDGFQIFTATVAIGNPLIRRT